MRVVVTGGDGFAGRWLCRQLLAEGAYVCAWVRRSPSAPIDGVDYRVQDVRDARGCQDAMRAGQPHQVFHLAAITHVGQADAEPIAAHDTNVRGTANVMAAVPRLSTAVLASTVHVYGRPDRLPITEDHPCAPEGTYAATKHEAESAARAACPQVVIARAFHHTGPGQSTRFALADWADKVARGEPIRVGDLSLRRDYLDVRDVCDAYRLLARQGAHQEVYNICSGDAPQLRALLTQLAQTAPSAVTEDPLRMRAHDVPELRGSAARLEALGWRRRIGQAQMLSDLLSAARDT